MLRFKFIFVLIPIFLIFMSCKKESSYLSIMNSNLSSEEKLSSLIRFEKEHTEDFCSKVDLANYYMLLGDYSTANDYLTRAESVIKKCPNGKTGRQYKTLLYGMKAHICLYQNESDNAISYVDLVLKQDKKANQHFNFIKGHAYIQKNDNEMALKIFDTTYKHIPEQLTADDQKAYMYLLANAQRYEETKDILEKYFENGDYFYGLGLFASSVYERLQDYNKALLAAYLDYEYKECFTGINKNQFFNDLDSIVNTFSSSADVFIIQNTIRFLKSLYDTSITVDYDSDFFVSKYITILKKIRDHSFSNEDVETFLALENKYSAFPSYYWNAWNAFIGIDSSQKATYVPLLNKILLLGENIYSNQARIELGKIVGLSENESKNILLAQEVDNILRQFTITNDSNLLLPIFEVISLPENIYEINALAILKQYMSNIALRKELESKKNTSKGRLKERLDYLLIL